LLEKVQQKKSFPAFQFYVQRWLSSTKGLSPEAKGVYIDFLAYSWDNGPLPHSETVRATIAGVTVKRFRSIWLALEPKWQDTAVGYINIALETQRGELEAYRESQRARAAQRWNHAGVDATAHASASGGHVRLECSPISDLPDQTESKDHSQSVAEPEVVGTYPTQGKARTWALTKPQLDAWQDAYTGLNVRSECIRAKEWLKANPKKIRTPQGMPRFLVNWLNRATERAGAATPTRVEFSPRTRTGDSLEAGKRSLERRLAKIAAEEGGLHDHPQIAGTRES
jgi:uncharacterized protein YdaU (DUF1376 family)